MSSKRITKLGGFLAFFFACAALTACASQDDDTAPQPDPQTPPERTTPIEDSDRHQTPEAPHYPEPESPTDENPEDEEEREPLYDGFDRFSRETSTDVELAQRYFDQGLQWLYGFNHEAAIRSFEEAAELDPDYAMAWWGIAYAHGIHINNTVMTEEASRRAYEATQEAHARLEHASEVEQDLIRALDARYEMPPPEERTHLDEAFAEEMAEVWRAHPEDADVGALYAESLMNLQPWDLWTPEGEPKGRAEEIVALLEEVIALDENHPAANHLYIHAVEASPEPERALPSAERLAALIPGAGHLVHMPSHIYARLGMWEEASDANTAAIAVDRAYFERAPEVGFYALYYLHNVEFLVWSAMMEGRFEASLRAARDIERDMPEAFLREATYVADSFMVAPYHVLIRFGKWDDMLEEPEPAEFRHFSRATWHYGRCVAHANLGQIREARRELRAFEQARERVPEDWIVMQNTAHDVLDIAALVAEGELAYHDDRAEDAFRALREAVELEDALNYDEPPGWMMPVRHAYGALLLAEGQAQEAEQVYLRDLERHPNNGWALLGLAQAYEAQRRADEAEATRQRKREAFSRADVEPRASCFCHPEAR